MSAVRGGPAAVIRVTYAVPGASAVLHSVAHGTGRGARRQRRVTVARVALAVQAPARLVLAVTAARAGWTRITASASGSPGASGPTRSSWPAPVAWT